MKEKKLICDDESIVNLVMVISYFGLIIYRSDLELVPDHNIQLVYPGILNPGGGGGSSMYFPRILP